MKTWVLVDDKNLILASCETYKMPSTLKLQDGSLSWGHTQGIASVFVEDQFRRRGHASEMLRSLVDQQRGEPGLHAFILYSEVGEKLYQDVGFRSRKGFERIFPASPEADWKQRAVPLAPADLDTLWSKVIPRADSRPDVSSFSITDKYRIWPSLAQLHWHLDRQNVYADLLGRARPDFCGARLPGGNGDPSFVLWIAHFRDDVLEARYLRCAGGGEEERRAQAAALAACAAEYAGSLGLSRAVIWEEEDCGPSAWPAAPLAAGGAGTAGPSRRERDDCVPMILPVAPGLEPQDWSVISYSMWI